MAVTIKPGMVFRSLTSEDFYIKVKSIEKDGLIWATSMRGITTGLSSQYTKRYLKDTYRHVTSKLELQYLKVDFPRQVR